MRKYGLRIPDHRFFGVGVLDWNPGWSDVSQAIPGCRSDSHLTGTRRGIHGIKESFLFVFRIGILMQARFVTNIGKRPEEGLEQISFCTAPRPRPPMVTWEVHRLP